MANIVEAILDKTGVDMLPITLPGPVVSADWLAKHLYEEDLVVFDASLALPGAAAITSIVEQIGNAQFFDINLVCDKSNPLPHMMPDALQFTEQVRQLGVNQNSTVVIYDDKGIYSSARVWWMFQAMGFERVAVLDGGLPAWQQAGYPCYNALNPADPQAGDSVMGDFVANAKQGYFCDADTLHSALSNPQINVLDARSKGRFTGAEADPRPGMRSGHMPGAVNLHYALLFETDSGSNSDNNSNNNSNKKGLLKSKDELTRLFQKYSPNKDSLIFSCGSGVTACILALGANIVGIKDICVYDGSWSEWGGSERPVVYE